MQNLHDPEGAAAVEYAIMIALVASVIFATVALIGDEVVSLFDSFVTALGRA